MPEQTYKQITTRYAREALGDVKVRTLCQAGVSMLLFLYAYVVGFIGMCGLVWCCIKQTSLYEGVADDDFFSQLLQECTPIQDFVLFPICIFKSALLCYSEYFWGGLFIVVYLVWTVIFCTACAKRMWFEASLFCSGWRSVIEIFVKFCRELFTKMGLGGTTSRL